MSGISTKKDLKLWGGRFAGETDPLLQFYNASLPFDQKMYDCDLAGTKVYTEGLLKIGLLSEEELQKIHDSLEVIREEWDKGEFEEKPGDEDITRQMKEVWEK